MCQLLCKEMIHSHSLSHLGISSLILSFKYSNSSRWVLGFSMHYWARKNTIAVPAGHKSFRLCNHLHSYIWEPTARTTGAEALKFASGCCCCCYYCCSLLLPIEAWILYGFPFPCHQLLLWSLFEKARVMYRICN